MNLKPKKTTFNAPMAIYRRITGLESSRSILTAYNCQGNNSLFRTFLFDYENLEFVESDLTEMETQPKAIVNITNATIVFANKGYYFYWNKLADNGAGAWVKTQTLPQTYTTLKELGFNDIGKYQVNKYVYVGEIDYIVTGEVAGTKTQPLKGLIMPLSSMNIKYYNDDLVLEEEDLVVVNGQLFSVENPDFNIKHQPRPYIVYNATLNSILQVVK